jgi:hypothetical protein
LVAKQLRSEVAYVRDIDIFGIKSGRLQACLYRIPESIIDLFPIS